MIENLPCGDGNARVTSTSKYPILDSRGNVFGVYCISRDITMLRRTQSQLELLTGAIPGGLAAYSVTPTGIETLYFNDAYYAFSGYSKDEYVAMTEKEPLALMVEEDRPGFLAMLRELMDRKADGSTASSTYRCCTKGGDIRWMGLRAILADMGDDRYVINVVQMDITEQKKADAERKELLENLPCGAAMYVFDGKELKALHINRQYEILTGRTTNSANSDQTPVDNIHPDDRKAVMDAVKDGIAEHRNAFCDARVRYGEDEYRTFHIDARISLQDDGTYLLFVTYTHIPEQVQSFRNTLPFMFQTIMESSTDLAFAKDTLTGSSPEGLRLLGTSA